MKANLYDDEDEINELTKPIKAVEEKWKLLPHFLRMRGLMRQHIDSFDYFINVDIKQIVAARSNCEVRSEADPKFFLRYTDIYVGEPNLEEEAFVTSNGIVLKFLLLGPKHFINYYQKYLLEDVDVVVKCPRCV